MKKIFIVLFILLASSVYAESKKLYEKTHNIGLDSGTAYITLWQDSNEQYSLRAYYLIYEENISTGYIISSSDVEKLKELLVNLERSSYNYPYYFYDVVRIESNKKFKFIEKKISIEGTDEPIIYEDYYYEYN